MSCRVRLLLGFSMAAMAAQGCSSSKAAAPSSDAGDDSDSGTPASSEGGALVDDGSSEVVDSGPAMVCDGSLPAYMDGGGPSPDCTACKVKSCATELAQCAMDCVCGPIETCLEGTVNTQLTACPGAINAVMGGNQTLPKLIDCLDTNCLMPCFMDTGDDAGVTGGEQ